MKKFKKSDVVMHDPEGKVKPIRGDISKDADDLIRLMRKYIDNAMWVDALPGNTWRALVLALSEILEEALERRPLPQKIEVGKIAFIKDTPGTRELRIAGLFGKVAEIHEEIGCIDLFVPGRFPDGCRISIDEVY